MAVPKSAPKKPAAATTAARLAPAKSPSEVPSSKAVAARGAGKRVAPSKRDAAPAKASSSKKAETPAKASSSKKAATPAKVSSSKKAAATAKASPSKQAATSRAGSKPSARARGVSVETYLEGLPPAHAAIGRRLEAIAASEIGAPGTIKWGQPVWEAGGPVAYMRGASRHVTFGFWRGAELADPAGKLVGEGSRMRHLRLTSLGELDEPLLRRLLREAVALNARHGDPTRAS